MSRLTLIAEGGDPGPDPEHTPLATQPGRLRLCESGSELTRSCFAPRASAGRPPLLRGEDLG